MRRAPLRRRSKKRQREDRQRADLMRALAEVRGEVCQAQLPGCQGRAVDGHEIDTRGRGGSALEAANVLLVCRNCHTWITEHPTEAAERGLVAHSWDTDKPTAPPWGAIGLLALVLNVSAPTPGPAPSATGSPIPTGAGSPPGGRKSAAPLLLPPGLSTVACQPLDRPAYVAAHAIRTGWVRVDELLSRAIRDARRHAQRQGKQ